MDNNKHLSKSESLKLNKSVVSGNNLFGKKIINTSKDKDCCSQCKYRQFNGNHDACFSCAYVDIDANYYYL